MFENMWVKSISLCACINVRREVNYDFRGAFQCKTFVRSLSVKICCVFR